MGAWGPAIFSDDLACDVRDDFKDLLGEGVEGPAAIRKLLERHSQILKDSDEAAVFWLALAATQHKCGRLEEGVKQEALAIIARRDGIARWDEAGKGRERARVLGKLAMLLQSTQPSARRVAKRHLQTTELRPGQVIQYTMLEGVSVLLKVLNPHTDAGGTAPCVELLDWTRKQPLPKELDQIPSVVRLWASAPAPARFIVFSSPRKARYPADRIVVIGTTGPPKNSKNGGVVAWWGGHFDLCLREALKNKVS